MKLWSFCSNSSTILSRQLREQLKPAVAIVKKASKSRGKIPSDFRILHCQILDFLEPSETIVALLLLVRTPCF